MSHLWDCGNKNLLRWGFNGTEAFCWMPAMYCLSVDLSDCLSTDTNKFYVMASTLIFFLPPPVRIKLTIQFPLQHKTCHVLLGNIQATKRWTAQAYMLYSAGTNQIPNSCLFIKKQSWNLPGLGYFVMQIWHLSYHYGLVKRLQRTLTFWAVHILCTSKSWQSFRWRWEDSLDDDVTQERWSYTWCDSSWSKANLHPEISADTILPTPLLKQTPCLNVYGIKPIIPTLSCHVEGGRLVSC